MTCQEVDQLRGKGMPTTAVAAAFIAHLKRCPACLAKIDKAMQAAPASSLQSSLNMGLEIFRRIKADPEADDVMTKK